ncbi:acyl-CoA dehydrogenase family protein [Stappia indica]|uniref:acyl-CoA dehydrogenase family protein n=1 Tax=Stappia indica TaxID=538381 RepID=UPI00082FBFF4|nr:acyl-CoA dehydrogenase family protein [Stappia indica]
MTGLDWECDRGFLDHVRAFAAGELAEQAAAGPLDAAANAQLLLRAAELGLTGIEVPRSVGGLGLGFREKAKACEILAGVDFGFALSLVNTHNVAARLAVTAPPELAARLLPDLLAGRHHACTALTEPHAGSDFFAISTMAQRTGDGWCLHGEKAWIANGAVAGLSIVYAQTGTVGERDGIAAFLVRLDDPAVSRTACSVDAFVPAPTGGFALDAYRVPDGEMLLPPGGAFRAILNEINGARAYVAAMCCGMLAAALESAHGFGRERRSFGQPLQAHQHWRLRVAEGEVALAAARALTAAAVEAVAEEAASAQLLAAQAKIAATHALGRWMPELLHALGAAGLSGQTPMKAHLAAAQVVGLVDGSTEMLLERVAALTGRRKTGLFREG